MARKYNRSVLLASAAVLTGALVHGAQAQTTIYGGGASLPSEDYAGSGVTASPTPTSPSEFSSEQGIDSHFKFKYFYASSGKGQAAFATDTPSAYGDTNSADPVHYAASDAFIAIGSPLYPPSSYPRLSTDGPYIQIPMLGVGIAFPALSGNSHATANGSLKLTDTDLCGIFSGKITNWSSVPGAVAIGVSGTITVNYRADSSGTSFLFTNHLSKVCNSGNSNFTALSAAPTTKFATLFTGYTTSGTNTFVPASLTNFRGDVGSAAIATALAGTVTTKGGSTVGQGPETLGVGYISPDFTAISTVGQGNTTPASNTDGTPGTGYINSKKLYDAAVRSGSSYLTPTTSNISQGLTHPGAGSTNPTPPPSAGAAANQLAWVPSIPVVTQGYPVVGYTNWLVSTCYSNSNVAAGLVEYLNNHFTGKFNTVISANGFVVTPGSYNTAIIATFLKNSNGFKLNINDPSPAGGVGTGNSTLCAGKSGR